MSIPAGAASGGAASPLWEWVLAAYRVEGVPEACLSLQDAHGHNVPLLLWAAWMSTTGRVIDPETVEAGCDTARAWDAAAVIPLRAIRRTLKKPLPDVDDVPREAVRAQVKALELAAERHLLTGLEALSSPSAGPPIPAIQGLVTVARSWNRVVPRPALATLAGLLPA